VSTPKPPEEKNVKKTVSVTADQWAYVMRKAGKLGVASKVVQEALRQMMEREP
jgi:hypothetical protein